MRWTTCPDMTVSLALAPGAPPLEFQMMSGGLFESFEARELRARAAVAGALECAQLTVSPALYEQAVVSVTDALRTYRNMTLAAGALGVGIAALGISLFERHRGKR